MFENFSDILTVEELSKALKIGRGSAYKLLQDNAIPYKRIAGKYRIPKHFVIEYVSGREYENATELQIPEEVVL